MLGKLAGRGSDRRELGLVVMSLKIYPRRIKNNLRVMAKHDSILSVHDMLSVSTGSEESHRASFTVDDVSKLLLFAEWMRKSVTAKR